MAKTTTDNFTIPASDLEGVGAPAQVRLHDNDLAVMDPAFPATGRFLQQKAVLAHQTVDPLVVRQGLVAFRQVAAQKRCDPAVAVGWPLVDEAPG
ncbi:MAG: hypothetical protein GY798_02900 [Hyphomicrobiales bacterium]|nr:hypothetical protein [Hyphomicrobiales bacterium]